MSVLQNLPTIEELRAFEASAAKPASDMERILAIQNLVVAAYKMRRRLEAVAMGRDVEATVLSQGGGA